MAGLPVDISMAVHIGKSLYRYAFETKGLS